MNYDEAKEIALTHVLPQVGVHFEEREMTSDPATPVSGHPAPRHLEVVDIADGYVIVRDNDGVLHSWSERVGSWLRRVCRGKYVLLK